MLSIYHSLLPSEIRLLRLLPSGDKSATLKAQLFNLSFLESGETVHPYYALSYVWGGNDKPRSLSISGHNLPITESLYEALSRLRHSSIERILWVDAVCINQDDEREKEQQIRIMANVYAQASCVVVWLGPEADDSDKALEAIRAAANPLGQNSTHPEDAIVAVRKLLQGPWFRRIWVFYNLPKRRAAFFRTLMLALGAARGRFSSPGCGKMWKHGAKWAHLCTRHNDQKDAMGQCQTGELRFLRHRSYAQIELPA